jgi:hypothetical protein
MESGGFPVETDLHHGNDSRLGFLAVMLSIEVLPDDNGLRVIVRSSMDTLTDGK